MRLWPMKSEPVERLQWILRDRAYQMRWRVLLCHRHWMIVLIRDGKSGKDYTRDAGQ